MPRPCARTGCMSLYEQGSLPIITFVHNRYNILTVMSNESHSQYKESRFPSKNRQFLAPFLSLQGLLFITAFRTEKLVAVQIADVQNVQFVEIFCKKISLNDALVSVTELSRSTKQCQQYHPCTSATEKKTPRNRGI